MKKVLLLFNLILLSFCLNSQIYKDEEADPKLIKPWINENEYFGAYSFGFSEGKFSVFVWKDLGKFYVRFFSFEWSEKLEKFIPKFTNFDVVSLNGDKIQFGNNKGQFVKYDQQNALKIYFDGQKEYEIGTKYGNLELFGDYSFVSFRKLTEHELQKYSARELKIMRNEIFARLGYKFKEGGEMDKYFRQKEWYVPARQNVDNMLNEIEKYNIDMIKKVEAIKN